MESYADQGLLEVVEDDTTFCTGYVDWPRHHIDKGQSFKWVWAGDLSSERKKYSSARELLEALKPLLGEELSGRLYLSELDGERMRSLKLVPISFSSVLLTSDEDRVEAFVTVLEDSPAFV